MMRVFTAALALAALVACGSASQAAGHSGFRCGPACVSSCVTYETKELTCYKTVYETHWKDVVQQCVRYECQTEWVDKAVTECIPHTDWVTKQVPYTVCKPVWDVVEKPVTKYRYTPVTVQKTCTVDRGHWAVQACGGGCAPVRRWCGGCGSCRACCAPCRGHKVWVPNVVTETYPCTTTVCEPYTVMVPVKVCRYEYEQLTKEVKYPVRRNEYVQKTIKVAVNKTVAVPYEVVRKVSYCVPKQVPYTVTVCTPVYTPCAPVYATCGGCGSCSSCCY